MSVELLQRAASSAAWLTAVLRGAVGVEHALDVVSGDDEPPLFFVPGEEEPLTLPFAVARWRQLDAAGWMYLPVAPGDAAGLPGPATFSAAALDRGVALVAVGGPLLGLLPNHDSDGVWVECPTSAASPGYVDSPAEAERSLLEALNSGVAALETHHLANWRDDAEDIRDHWSLADPMPPGTDPRSERLALRSRRILELLEAAGTDDGGGRTAAEMAIRRSTLADLARTARYAHAVAWNAGLRRLPSTR